jgi:hypothetical protein
MADSRHITRRAAIVGAASLSLAAATQGYEHLPPHIQAAAKVRELSRELSIALNGLNRPVRVTIEPSEAAARPVLMEDLVNPVVDHLEMMNRGLKMMEEGAMLRNPNISGLGMIWGGNGARYQHFHGVAVSYRAKPE